MSVYEAGRTIKKINELIGRVAATAKWLGFPNGDHTVKWSRIRLGRIERQLTVLEDLTQAIDEVLPRTTVIQAEWCGELRDKIDNLRRQLRNMEYEEHQLLNQKENDQ